MWRDIDPRVPERERPEPGFGRVGGQTEVESGPVSDDLRDVFTRDLDLPRGSSRERVRVNDKEYRLSGDDVRVLATVGAFRVSVSTLSDGPPVTQIDGRGHRAGEARPRVSRGVRLSHWLPPGRHRRSRGTGNGPAHEARPVVLRESSVVLGSLASGALSPTEARRVGRIVGAIRSVGVLPVSVSLGV